MYIVEWSNRFSSTNIQICEDNKLKYQIKHPPYLQAHIIIFCFEAPPLLFFSSFYRNSVFTPFISMS